MKNRSRASSRLARRQTKNSEKTADIVNGGTLDSGVPNGQTFDLDLIFGGPRSKYPICAPLNKKVNTHNLAEIPSLQSDEDNSVGGDNVSQNSENGGSQRQNHAKRKNANMLIESRNKFRQLLNQIQVKSKPHSVSIKHESAFDGYELKSRKIKFEPKKGKKDYSDHHNSSSKSMEFSVKVFDKTLDLSSYCKMNPNQYIPLYPICRMWARNNCGMPESLRSKRNYPPAPMNDCIDPDGPYSDQPVDVIHLPKPDPLPIDENGEKINLRIPKFIRDYKPKKSVAADHLNSMEHMNAQELLALSLPRWKRIRKEFLKASRENEHRYRHSFELLKSMFEKYVLLFPLFWSTLFFLTDFLFSQS